MEMISKITTGTAAAQLTQNAKISSAPRPSIRSRAVGNFFTVGKMLYKTKKAARIIPVEIFTPSGAFSRRNGAFAVKQSTKRLNILIRVFINSPIYFIIIHRRLQFVNNE